ncbi:sodium:proton antiporter [Campylobacter sp.]|uniref:sodium:proton antiporter n=1 Tax=Campylobacter sp. TaxID=205 RepID=UPI0026FFBACE|nr:sodium:proton antiporter [Campylobacter sp.]
MAELADLMFENQLDAAAKLLEILPKKDLVANEYLIICSSIDAVILTDIVSRGLNLSYEMLFTERIFAPNNPECEIAMVSESDEILVHDELVKSFGISYDFIFGEAQRKYEEKILKNVYRYRKGNLIGNLKDRNILLIDEGCETGMTAMICLKTLMKERVRSVSYATPLIATNVANTLLPLVDEIYAVHKIANFIDVDFYYENKIEPKPSVILSILEESPFYIPLQKQGDTKACNIQ